jgi:protoporphyrinogen oxidase
VVLRRPLSGFYLTYFMDDAPFTTIIEMTSLVDSAEVGGHTLVYLPQYVASDDPLLDADDTDVERPMLEGLRALYPDLTDDDVIAVRTARARQVFPLPVLGYSATVAPVATSVPGLFLVSSARIVNGTLNVNETVSLGDAAAPLLLA